MRVKRMRSRRDITRRALLFMGVVLLLWLSGLYWWYRHNLTAPSANATPKVVIINSGESVGEIAMSLKNEHVIRNATIFTLYLTLHGLRSRVQAGAYELKANQSAIAVAGILTGGQTAEHTLTIPEGFTIAAIKARAESNGFSAADLDAALAADYPGTQAAARPSNVDLEGYLFPDTYNITPATTAHDLIQSMLTRFDQRISPDLIAGLQAQGLNLHQGLTLASIVEKEVASPADQALVAGVFLNRLHAGMKLQSDVTVDYGAAQIGRSFSISLQSPYNTYVVSGLPIGPICNPGLAALNAVAHPTPSNYLYFVAGKDGKTHYATTSAEHEANVRKYLN